MKKIIIIGCPGSGKSTFARALHQKTGIALYHLDMMYWNADRSTVEQAEFEKRLAQVLEKDAWIIDGNYASTMERRLALCDTVFFLDYQTQICLAGVRERRGKARDDLPWVETERDDAFIAYIQSFNTLQRPAVLELLQKYRDKTSYIFTCREQADSFLSALKTDLDDE